jgi:hypothetical protein
MSFAKFLPAAIALMVGASSASADTAFANSVAYWNQQGQPGNQSFTAGTGATHITAESMVRGAGLGANAGGSSLNSNGWTGQATDYVEFGFAVDSGFAATLDKLYLATKVSATGPTAATIYTSLDGFANPIATIAQNNTVTGTPYTNSVIDLSGFGRVTGTLTFHLFGSGATSSAGTLRVGDYYSGSAYYFDSVTGSVAAVPEPETYAMMLAGLGLLGFAARGRNK